MGERPDFNRVVIDSIVRSVQHERNCGCERCLGKARQSIAWVNEQSPEAEREDARREQIVINAMSRSETKEAYENRMLNTFENDAVGALAQTIARLG